MDHFIVLSFIAFSSIFTENFKISQDLRKTVFFKPPLIHHEIWIFQLIEIKALSALGYFH